MTEFSMMDYLPILVMFVVAFGFAASQVLVTELIGPKKRTATKLMPYECGKDPVGSARERFSVKFYNVAVVFLIFDIEVLFMIPFAVVFKGLFAIDASYGTIAFIEIMIFIATFIIGLIYAWKKGIFDWNVQARSEAKSEARTLKEAKLQMVRDLKRAA